MELKEFIFSNPKTKITKTQRSLASLFVLDEKGACYNLKEENVRTGISRIMRGELEISKWFVLSTLSIVKQKMPEKYHTYESFLWNKFKGVPTEKFFSIGTFSKALQIAFNEKNKITINELILALDYVDKLENIKTPH